MPLAEHAGRARDRLDETGRDVFRAVQLHDA
jgi:hypothetical protein